MSTSGGDGSDFFAGLFSDGFDPPSPELEAVLQRLEREDAEAWLAAQAKSQPLATILAAAAAADRATLATPPQEAAVLARARRLAEARLEALRSRPSGAGVAGDGEVPIGDADGRIALLFERLVLEAFVLVVATSSDATAIAPLSSAASGLEEAAAACASQPTLRDLFFAAAARLRGPVIEPQLRAQPRFIGAYRIERRVGGGAMGQVYEGRAPDGRRVAVKVLRYWIQDASTERRFREEIDILGQLDHASIAKIVGSGTLADAPYHATDFIDGLDLLEHARRYQLSRDERLRLLIQVCDAVDYAHGRGVVHRDLKPSNILVEADGTPKVLDFGIALRVDVSTMVEDSAVDNPSPSEVTLGDISSTNPASGPTRTASGAAIGTPGYMSPEQCLGKRSAIGPASDVYALGVLLYELASGERPHDCDRLDPLGAMRMTVLREPRPLDKLTPVPQALAAIAYKAVARRAKQRYPRAGALAAELRAFLSGETVHAKYPGPSTRLVRKVQQHRGLAALGAALLVVLVAVTWVVASERAVAAADRNGLETTRVAYESLVRQIDRAAPQESIALGKRVLERIQVFEADAPSPELERFEFLVRGRLGGLYVRVGERGPALQERDACLEYWQSWTRAHPQDREAQGYLSLALVERGDLEKHVGRLDEALEYYEQALRIDEACVAAEPESRLHRDNLIWSYLRLGEFCKELRHNLTACARWYSKANACAERLAEQRPNCIPTLWTLSQTKMHLYWLMCYTPAVAAQRERLIEEAHACVERLAPEKPGKADIGLHYGVIRSCFGGLLTARGDNHGAERVYVVAIHDVKLALHTELIRGPLQLCILDVYSGSIHNLIEAGDLERARARFREFESDFGGYAQADPSMRIHIARARIEYLPRLSNIKTGSAAYNAWFAEFKILRRYQLKPQDKIDGRGGGYVTALWDSPGSDPGT